MIQRQFASYTHSAFFSYAAGDDIAWNKFVTEFARQLDRGLAPRTRRQGIKMPTTFLYGKDPLVQGNLANRLREKVDASFAMFVFVHDCYLISDFCLQELQHFKELFGDEGFRDRLYIVAMSRPAITELVESERWKKLCPNAGQIWTEFYDSANPMQPLQIYANEDDSPTQIMVNPFYKLFLKVREDLVTKITDAVDREQHCATYPTAAAEPVAPLHDERLVRLYIEGDKEQVPYWESLGRQIETSWKLVVEPQELTPPFSLQPTGLTMSEIDKRATLDDADGVVLLWDNKTPDSLAAQVRKVEPKLSGSNFAPGLIAYCNEVGKEMPASIRVGNWNVVRFQRSNDGRARVMPADAPLLGEFLNSVFERKRQGLGPSIDPAGGH